MTEDAHLDTPELGDTVEFEAMGEYGRFQAEGEVTLVSPRARTVAVKCDGKVYRSIPFGKVFVLRKAA